MLMQEHIYSTNAPVGTYLHTMLDYKLDESELVESANGPDSVISD